MKNLLLIILIGLTTSCLDLDDNLFNPNTDIDQYYFDDFEGRQEVQYDFKMPKNKIQYFTLPVGLSNEKIHLVYLGDSNTINTDTVLLYCHGNAGHMDFYWNRAKLLANLDSASPFGVLMLDYRGFGLSEGKPTESNMYEDVNTAINWLTSKGLNKDRFIMYGFSLGSAPTIELTAKPRNIGPTKILIESPFASVDVMVQDGSGLALNKSYFTNLEIDNAEEIKTINQPFYWIHGTSDDFLDMETHGEVVYKNHNGSYKEAHRIEGAGHGNVPKIMGLSTYQNSVLTFIRK